MAMGWQLVFSKAVSPSTLPSCLGMSLLLYLLTKNAQPC